ncbi:MAG: redoxin domain-containing protein [Rhodothermales bacterium]
MDIKEGTLAPDFMLFDHTKTPFRLSDYRGKKNVLILFFPGAFTSVCTTELNTVSNELEEFGTDSETQVVGISTDSPFVLDEFRKVHHLRFPLLSDHNAEVSALFGAKYDSDFTPMKLDRISKRAAFIVDKEGVIRYTEVLENAGNLPNFDIVKNVLSSIKD